MMRMLLRFSRLRTVWRAYCKNRRGAAAAEFAVILPLLAIPILNVVDLGAYAWDGMELDNAAQVGAQAAGQAAWNVCSPQGSGPYNYYLCSAMTSAATTAADSTTLGNVWQSTVEEYCCPGATGSSSVTCYGPVSTTDVTKISCTYEDYLLVTATYTYAPIFSGVSVASLLTTPITRTSYMRLD